MCVLSGIMEWARDMCSHVGNDRLENMSLAADDHFLQAT